MSKGKPARDKSVFAVHVYCVMPTPTPWRLIAVSVDCTLPELHRTIQGAFDAWDLSVPCIVIGKTRYENG